MAGEEVGVGNSGLEAAPHPGWVSLNSPPWFFNRMQGAGKALHELLVSAQRQGCLTAGVYESAKVLNV